MRITISFAPATRALMDKLRHLDRSILDGARRGLLSLAPQLQAQLRQGVDAADAKTSPTRGSRRGRAPAQETKPAGFTSRDLVKASIATNAQGQLSLTVGSDMSAHELESAGISALQARTLSDTTAGNSAALIERELAAGIRAALASL